jgi:hypothetical protein
VQYDWDAYYKPFISPIAGHTNTPGDPVGIRAFRVARAEGGVVAVQWKAKAESGEWRGADGNINTTGFLVLKGRPRGMPSLIEPNRYIMDKKYYKQLIGKKMTECLEAEGAMEARAWLAKAAKHGVIPVHRRLEGLGIITPGEFGSKVELKCDDATAVVQMIEDSDQTAEEFWALPAEVLRVLEVGRVAKEAMSKRHLLHPAVGYQSVPVARRPTFAGSAAESRLEDVAQEGKEDEDGSELDDSSDEEAPLVNNASRSNGAEAQRQNGKKRKRGAAVVAEAAEEVDETVMDVRAVFGEGPTSREVWFGVNRPCKTNGKVRIQFLAQVDGVPGMYQLSAHCETYTVGLVKHTFKDTVFISTTTYQLTKKTKRRQKNGKEIKVITKAPLDPKILDALSHQCLEVDDDSD